MSENKITEELTLGLENLSSLNKRNKEDVEILELADEGKTYLLSHEWCEDINDGWAAVYWEGILGVFLFKIESHLLEVDDYVWVVVGDMPTAYIDISSAKNSDRVLESYVALMNDWVQCVENDSSIENCYPVEVPPTIEYAAMLKSRMQLISEELNNK